MNGVSGRIPVREGSHVGALIGPDYGGESCGCLHRALSGGWGAYGRIYRIPFKEGSHVGALRISPLRAGWGRLLNRNPIKAPT